MNSFSISTSKGLKFKHKRRISWVLSAILACTSWVYQTEMMIFVLLGIAFLSFLGNYKWLMFSSLICTIAICEQFQTQYKNQHKNIESLEQNPEGKDLQNTRTVTADKSRRAN